MELKDLLKIKMASGNTASLLIYDDPAGLIQTLTASAVGGLLPQELGEDTAAFRKAIIAAIYQDDDAHDTCSLTACLNPLHPGPCKGWKGALFNTAPAAFHALEKAKADKANATRVKKIEDLKAKGLPIPKKLLTPILPKPHPHAGQTANSATGEAHEAGKAVTESAGIHVNAPGKVTLGQAIKQIKATDATADKGPKGKKPTVMSKGIAAVIAQEKVTPQYKLDKAATITPEQWAGLTGDEKSTIRGELANISINGFGPQQEKANALLAKLPAQPAAPKIAHQHMTLAEHQAANAELQKKAYEAAKAAGPIKLPEANNPADNGGKAKPVKLTATHNGETSTITTTKPYTHASVVHYPWENGGKGKTGVASFHTSEELAKKGSLTGEQKKNGAHVVTVVPVVKAESAAEAPKTKLSDSVKEAAKQAHADEVAAAKPLPAHVQHAIDMANGTAPGASWSKNHLAAYQKLTPEEYKALPPDVQAKVKSELEKAQTKFLDPKKVQAAKDLLAKFKGASPGTTKIENKPEAPKEIGFQQHLNDHSVTQAQAKTVVDQAPLTSLFAVAKHSAGVTDMENPDNPDFIKNAEDGAKSLVNSQTKLYTPAILDTPAVKAAIDHAQKSISAELHARLVDDAAKQAFNKVSKKLYADSSPQVTAKLSPIQAAALKKYQKHLVGDVAKADIDALTTETKKASTDLDAALHKALADANAASPSNMTGAQLDSKVKELLGSDVVDPTKPQISPSLANMQYAKKMAAVDVAADAKKYPAGVLTDPGVAAKQADYIHAVTQLNATKMAQDSLADHIKQLHEDALLSGEDHQGNPLSATDKQIIALHAAKLGEDYKAQAGEDAVQQAQAKVVAAKEQFHAAAEKAASVPHEPVKLSDYDQTAISTSFSDAWGKHASKATTYGVDYSTGLKMKGHPEYAQFTQDLGNLKALAGKVALAHAEEHTAKLNVPTDPATGDLEHGPEYDNWQIKVAQRVAAEKQFTALHKTTQARLDTIRTAAGLKKRALPKVESPAVKTAAAEYGFYKTYGKTAAAKSYMQAKVGDKLGVKHQTAAEKKAAKATTLGGTMTPSASTSPTSAPVAIGSDSSIAGIPDPLKKQITSDFKSMPSGKYLADPASDIFDNLVVLAAAHGKTVDGGLSVDQVLKTIDETHSKNLGMANAGMLHKKITEWLGTPAGKSYAEAHSAPDAKKVKQLTGELDLPKGVTLAPGEKVQKVAGPGPHDESLGPDVFKKASTVSAQAAQDQYMKDNGIKWSAQQKSAMKSYTGSMYHTYNSYLRGNGSANASVKQDVIDIQSAMMPLAQHTLLKRGTGWDALPAEYHGFENAKKLVGKSFTEPGFTSTTVAGESGHFGGPLQLEIEAPEGTAAAFVNGISHYKNKENEMLLAAGTKFKVLSVTQKGHQTVMRVRIVGDK